jgi:hypothetical protein
LVNLAFKSRQRGQGNSVISIASSLFSLAWTLLRLTGSDVGAAVNFTEFENGGENNETVFLGTGRLDPKSLRVVCIAGAAETGFRH